MGSRLLDVRTDVFSRNLVFELIERCRKAGCSFGLLTDEFMCAMLDCRGYDAVNNPEIVPLEVYSSEDLTVRTILTLFVYNTAVAQDLCILPSFKEFIPCRGALNNPPWTFGASGTCFRDFDLYTMQRDETAWEDFCRWKSEVKGEAELLVPGEILQMDPAGFGRLLTPFRSPVPDVRLEPEIMDSIARNIRPRSADVDAFLDSNNSLSFVITEAKQCGTKYFSQVFFGHLVNDPAGSPRVTCPQTLCLKLFDERWFPMPQQPDFSRPPEELLLDLNSADDMVRREEGAYDRLRHLQGSLIPHCYGFQEVRSHSVSICTRIHKPHYVIVYRPRRLEIFWLPHGGHRWLFVLRLPS